MQHKNFKARCLYVWHSIYFFFFKSPQHLLSGDWAALYDADLINGQWHRYYTYAPGEYYCLFYKKQWLITICTENGSHELSKECYRYHPDRQLIETTGLPWKIIRLNAHLLKIEIAIEGKGETEYTRTVFKRVG